MFVHSCANIQTFYYLMDTVQRSNDELFKLCHSLGCSINVVGDHVSDYGMCCVMWY